MIGFHPDFIREYAAMPYPRLDEEQSHDAPRQMQAARPDREDTLDDQEKVLDGRSDVNMLALLIKDVKGG
jgi:hypothetical protein